MRKKEGITLVTLIITVVILLILAGVVINLTIGERGIFLNSEQSVSVHNKQEATEKVNLKITYTQMRVYSESQRMPTLQEIANDFCKDNEIEYVELASKKVASLENIEVGQAKSIFTKLKQYPYEFEINDSLQLASIDGVKIANNNDTITLKKEEYDSLVQRIEKLENKNLEDVKMSEPINLTYTNLANSVTNIRSAGVYKASSNSFTKTNSQEMSSYLEYKADVGWKVLKSGWYYFDTIINGEPGVDGFVNSYLIINNSNKRLVNKWIDGRIKLCYETAHVTLFLNAGDVVDFSYELSADKIHSWANFDIYALFK